MTGFIPALLAALVVSAISLVGAALIRVSHSRLQRLLLTLVSFSAGALLGGALLHLLPEAVDEAPGSLRPFLFVLLGFVAFFVLEKALRVHHCHDGACETKQHIGTLNLVSDAVHNLIDGLVIAAAFIASVPLGVAVTVSVALHELPQELGDFGVLLYAGYTRRRALLLNALTALAAVGGVLLAFVASSLVGNLSSVLLPFAAGGFVYIAAADLIPELHRENNTGRSWGSFVTFAVALAFMWALKVFGTE